METLQFIKNKFSLNDSKDSVIKLPIDRYKGLTGLFGELGFKVGAEIGVLQGKYSKWICIKDKGVKLYLIDPYQSYDDYSADRTQEFMDASYEEAKVRLAKFNVEFVKKSSMDAVKEFADNSLDFVYIDGNHAFEWVMEDIIEWSKKVKPGGIVSGHDYSSYMFQVKDAVDVWVKVKKIKPLFLTGYKSWFYAKI